MTDPTDAPGRPWLPQRLAELVHLADNKDILVHLASECAGEACCIHNPSAHLLADRPLVWRPLLLRMDRVCQHHVRHPDPDGLAADVWLGRHTSTEHDCDGCCQPGPDRSETTR